MMQPGPSRARGAEGGASNNAPPAARFSLSGGSDMDSSYEGLPPLRTAAGAAAAGVGRNLFASYGRNIQSGTSRLNATTAASQRNNAATLGDDSSWGSPRNANVAGGGGGSMFTPVGAAAAPSTLRLAPTINNDVNPDGSFSVVQQNEADEADADASGLLGTLPMLFPQRAAERARQIREEAAAEQPVAGGRRRFDVVKKGRGHLNEIGTFGTASAGPQGSKAAAPAATPADISDAASSHSVDIIDTQRAAAAAHAAAATTPPTMSKEQEERADLLQCMRQWRDEAAAHFLFDTAIFWGDKILSMEDGQTLYNDAYWLASAYFLSHRYAQAEHLLTTPLRVPPPAIPKPAEDGEEQREKEAPAVSEADAMQEDEELPDAIAIEPSFTQRETSKEVDPLSAALEATRANSILPSSLLARSRKPGYLGGVAANEWQASTQEEHEEEADAAGMKRKERQFTVSGTGSASEAGSSEHRGTQGKGLTAHVEEEEEEQQHQANGITTAKRDLFELWKIEQRLAVEEIRDRQSLAPDGQALASCSSVCRYLAAQCMVSNVALEVASVTPPTRTISTPRQVRQGKFHEALDMLDTSKSEVPDEVAFKQPAKDGGIKLGSSKWHLRGQIFLRLDDKEQAKEAFMKSLALDVRNYDAFAALVEGRLLGTEEQWNFVEGLEYIAQAGNSNTGKQQAFALIRVFYTSKLDKEGQEHAIRASEARRELVAKYGMSDNADVLLGLAEELYARLRYADAHVVTKRILEISLDHEATLPIHIATMFHLPHLRPALFLLAHRLTDADPDMPAAWYAVGMWYACAERWQEARRFFSKCVHLDPRFCAGWIAFAHTFAFEGESDQAIISYSTAARHFPQNHLPKLFIGMEHIHQGSMTLAELNLQGSKALWDEDPLYWNEAGVVQYNLEHWAHAIGNFSRALELAEKTQEPASLWTSTHLNLGYAYRRAGNDDMAMRSLRRVLELNPHCSAAFVGLGMAAHRKGRIDDAIGFYHASLAITPREELVEQLLNLALQENATAVPLMHVLGDAHVQPLDLMHHDDDEEGMLDQSSRSYDVTGEEASMSHSSAANAGASLRESSGEEMDMSMSGAM